jgi:CheY-like chemotaxis protein
MVDAGEVTPDLAFIDLNMPRKNGLDLLVDLGERKAGGLPMVVLTSSSSPTDAMRSRLRSASRVLTKPDSIDALGAELSAAIAALAPFRPAHRGETTRPPI